MKMIKREEYKPRTYGLSSQNEPGNDTILDGNVRQYPDMYYAYKKFADDFHLPMGSFFLANGCENAMKNVLLALKPKSMVWCVPTWRFPEVYSAALDFKLITKEYLYNAQLNTFELPSDFYDTEADILYDNLGITTCFKYAFSQCNLYNTKTKYNIVDVTYKTINQMMILIPMLRKNPKNIIVGSFDKLVGAGLRLGFAIFPKELEEKMALQREQYINMLAFNWLVNTKLLDIKGSPYFEPLNDIIESADYITDNFLTVKGNVQTTLPCFHFTVDGYDFTRFGIPNSQAEFDALKLVLKDFINVRNKYN